MEFGKRLTELRELKGITVNKLANKAGLSQSYVREIEMSKKNPTVETLGFLCEALGISELDFFEKEFSNSLRNDPALRLLYRLDQEQRKRLCALLESMLE